jgi:hypothetical protein
MDLRHDTHSVAIPDDRDRVSRRAEGPHEITMELSLS